MDLKNLRGDTAKLWLAIKDNPLLNGFVLIGGTALTLHINHRISEDLDFSFSDLKLPKTKLKLLEKQLTGFGFSFVRDQSPTDEESFIDAGLSLEDFQQNAVVGGVKVSFVCFDPPMNKLIQSDLKSPLRVATLDELFKTKVFTCSERSKTRDWFDLYTLMNQYGYSFKDLHDVFQNVNRPFSFNIANTRLRSCTQSFSDEGYHNLMENPPDLGEIRQFFVNGLNELECELSSDKLRSSAPKGV